MFDLIPVILVIHFTLLILFGIFQKKVEKFFARFGIKITPGNHHGFGHTGHNAECSLSNSSRVEYTSYNPASGLPMSGGAIDIAGNLYGSSSNH